jgi:hypothetical protein
MMPAQRHNVVANLVNMSDVSDIAQWCLDRGHEKITLRSRRPHLADALVNAGLNITEGPSDLVMWLDDEIGSSSPWPHGDASCEVIVEGCLPVERGVHALAVETDRAVIVSSDGIDYRRIEFKEGESTTTQIHPIATDILDESARKAGFTLIERWVDWSMEPALGNEPCHLSLFRNF